MSEINIDSIISRENYMSRCSGEELNDYIKEIEVLAYQRGGKYQKAYVADIQYVLSMENNVNRYAYLDNLFRNRPDMQPNSYCPLITQKSGEMDNTCEKRGLDLDKISDNLKAVIDHKKKIDRSTFRHIRNFIEIIICCGSEFADDSTFRETKIIPIIKKITIHPSLTKIAYMYADYILKNEKNKYIKEYKKISDDIERFKSVGGINLEALEKKQKEYIDKYGMGVLLTTELIDWIFDQYEIVISV